MFWMVAAILGWFGAILLMSMLAVVSLSFGALLAEYEELKNKTKDFEKPKSSTSVWALRKEVPFSD
jgi:hypothetical protein